MKKPNPGTSPIVNVFLLSKVNGAEYIPPDESLSWAWPDSTFLRKRLVKLAAEKEAEREKE